MPNTQPTSRFGFAGRCSTEDNQDPESSRQWQLSRARTLIEPHGGEVVREFFDIGESRSLPWQRRPQAAALLDALRDPGRGFDAVVIGEPHRMFYGNQFGLIFPLFVHYGVDLWVPELGGRLDPNSDVQDLMMLLFGGLSKAERNRIKIRVRASMSALAATEGRFLGGRPPYGYQLADGGPHPHPAKAAAGLQQHLLVTDPVTGPVVARIFEMFLSGLGYGAIVHNLSQDGVPCPSAHDPGRNRHRTGLVWTRSAVRAILGNPRYTGRQVWNRQRRDEVLIDVDDVAMGHETRMRWNATDKWIWSKELAHEPLVTIEDFEAAQDLLDAGVRRKVERAKVRPTTKRTFVFRRRLQCVSCERRMEAAWRNGHIYYLCRYRHGQARPEDHPSTAYVREDALLRTVDRWLARVFDPDNLDDTIDTLTAADRAVEAEQDQSARRRNDDATKTLAECDSELLAYRAALKEGADPKVVTKWIAETQAKRLAAQRTLTVASARTAPSAMTRDDLLQQIGKLGDVIATIVTADPTDKAAIYGELGMTIRYDPATHTAVAECSFASDPCGKRSCRRGDLNPHVPKDTRPST